MLYEVSRPGIQEIKFKFLIEAGSEEEAFNKTEDMFDLGQYSIEQGEEKLSETLYDDPTVKYKQPDNIGDEYIFGERI